VATRRPVAVVTGSLRELPTGDSLAPDITATPSVHAATHASNGSDPVTPAAIGAVGTGDVRLARPRQAEAHAPALARTRAGLLTRNTAQLDILCIGDSITEGTGASTLLGRWVALLAPMLRARFPQTPAGGQGFIPALNIATSFVNGWTTAGATSGNGTFGLGHRTVVLSSPNGAITRTVSGTSITLAYTRTTGTGSFQVFLDGSGSPALTVNTATGANATAHDDGRATLSLGTRGSHTVKIAWSAGSDVYLNGIFVYDQDESSGIRVTESGQHGSRSADWSPAATSSAYVLDDDMAILQPRLVIIELCANDMIGGVPPVTSKANILDIISHVRSAVEPDPDILLLAAYDIGQNGYAYPWQSYVGQMRQIEAADASVSLLDLSAVMPRSNETDYGLIYGDGVHANDGGNSLIARLVVDYIAQGYHASQHALGGADPLAPAAIGAEASANRGAASGYASLDAAARIPAAQMPIVVSPIRAGSVSTAVTSDASSGAGNLVNLQITGDATINAPTGPTDWQVFEHHCVAVGAARNVTFGGGYVQAGAGLGPYNVPRGAVLIARSVYLGNRSSPADITTPAWGLESVRISDTPFPLASIGAVSTTRQVATGTGLSGGGDLSADRTLAVLYGATAGTAAQGNDSRITGAVQGSTATTKGDLLVASAAATLARLGVGADGQVLTADSTQALGVKWAAAAAGGGGAPAAHAGTHNPGGTDEVGLTPPKTITAATYAVLDVDRSIIADSTAQAQTITLPSPVGRSGKRYTVKKRSGGGTVPNLVTIGTAAGSIDGLPSETISVAGGFREFESDNTIWHIVGGKVEPVIVNLAAVAAGGTIAIDASIGSTYRVTASGATVILGVPTQPIDGDTIVVEILCSVACTITINASIIPTGGAGSSIPMAAGKRWFGTLRYITGVGWFLLGSGPQA
jgi:lysophospholipase L1-like esterase